MIAVESQIEPKPRTPRRPRDWTREEIVEKVQRLNPSATTDYLMRFDPDALRLYLAHLEWASLPRKARWHRPGDTRGLRVYEAAQ